MPYHTVTIAPLEQLDDLAWTDDALDDPDEPDGPWHVGHAPDYSHFLCGGTARRPELQVPVAEVPDADTCAECVLRSLQLTCRRCGPFAHL